MAAALFRCYTERSESENISTAGVLTRPDFCRLPLGSAFVLFPVSSRRPCPFCWWLHPLLSFQCLWHSTFLLSAAELFHALLLHPLAAAAAFLFLSCHPPTSCPILIQMWAFDTDFHSDPLLHVCLFVSCTYPWNVDPILLFSCAFLTREGSLAHAHNQAGWPALFESVTSQHFSLPSVHLAFKEIRK